MENDDALMYWLQDLSQYGAALIRDAPIREGAVPDLQERVNFQKLTHYRQDKRIIRIIFPCEV